MDVLGKELLLIHIRWKAFTKELNARKGFKDLKIATVVVILILNLLKSMKNSLKDYFKTIMING